MMPQSPTRSNRLICGALRFCTTPYRRLCPRFRRVVRLPFDSGPVAQSRDRRDVPNASLRTARKTAIGDFRFEERIGRLSHNRKGMNDAFAGAAHPFHAIGSTMRATRPGVPERTCALATGWKDECSVCGGTPICRSGIACFRERARGCVRCGHYIGLWGGRRCAPKRRRIKGFYKASTSL